MNKMRTIRLPIHIVKELNVYLRAERELSHKFDHDPSKKEIAEQLNKPINYVSRMLRLNECISSIDIAFGNAAEKGFLDVLSDKTDNTPESRIQNDEMKKCR